MLMSHVVVGVDLHHPRERPHDLTDGRPFRREIVLESARVPHRGRILEDYDAKTFGSHADRRSKAATDARPS